MTPRRLLFGLLLTVPKVAFAQNVAEVQVAPPTLTLKVGDRSGLLATAFDRIGNVIPTIRLIWSSNNVTVARVDNNGTVTAVAAGVAIVEAREARSGRRGQAAVQVIAGPGGAAPPPSSPVPSPQPSQPIPGTGTPPVDPYAGQPAGAGPPAALRIDPPAIYMLPSENTKVLPRALREDGSAAAPVLVTWKSLREDIASVDQNGNVVALAPGQGTLQVTGPGGLTATAPVVVQQADIAIYEQGPLMLSPGAMDTLHVTVPSQNNRQVSPLALQWTSSDPNVVKVSLTGVITAAGPGKAQLAVTGLLQSRAIDVQVHRPVEILVARPRSQAEIPLPLTGTQRFEAQALAADNTPVPEAPLRWSLSDTMVASFDVATGVLTGKAIGKTQLVVQGPGQGLSVVWTVNVIAGTVKLSASRLGLAPGERFTLLKANFTDDNGAVVAPATGLAWSTSDGNVAAVAEDGAITAVAFGHAWITATAPGGKTASVDVFVQGEILVASTRGGGGGKFELYALERSNLAALRKVGADTAGGTEPAFSPDGSRIAFVSVRDGNPEIYLMDADGSNQTRLTNDLQADGRPTFSGDGQSLLFHSARAGKNQQVFTMGLDGQGVRQLTQDSANTQPAVSPDGGTIAFVTTRDGRQPHIWLMARDGSNQRAFTRGAPNKDLQNRETYPQFVRDGSLLYLSERREGNRTVTQVVRAELATGTVTPVTGTDLFVSSFAVAPAGDLLALVVPLPGQERRRNPAFKVYIQTVGSGTPVPVPAAANEQMATPTFQP